MCIYYSYIWKHIRYILEKIHKIIFYEAKNRTSTTCLQIKFVLKFQFCFFIFCVHLFCVNTLLIIYINISPTLVNIDNITYNIGIYVSYTHYNTLNICRVITTTESLIILLYNRRINSSIPHAEYCNPNEVIHSNHHIHHNTFITYIIKFKLFNCQF